MNTNSPWRDEPNLRGRFLPDHPDDLQVIVHDGGPRLSPLAPELMWVRVLGGAGGVYSGQLLNVPQGLRSVALGSSILFVAPSRAEYPLRVTEKYLSERAAWKITPCDRCGLPELFDAPSDLIARIFPDLPPSAGMDAFTSFCPLCDGVQVVEAAAAAPAPSSQRPWWQLWKT